MMTKLKPQEKPFQYIMIEGKDDYRIWVTNKNFSVHMNDLVTIMDKKGSLAFVRVIRRTNIKPIKGEPIWRIVATANQFPVAENEQVVSCNHVAPSPKSNGFINHELSVAEDQMKNAIARVQKIKDSILNNLELKA